MVTHKPDLPNFKIHSCIGKACGGFANVYLARQGDAKPVAIRICPLDHPKVQLHLLEREVSFLSGLKHPNILPLLKVFVHANMLCLITPLLDYGSVTDLIHAKFMFGLPELAIAQVVQDVLRAVSYIHSKDFIHRAVRCSHMLVGSDGATRLAGFRYASAVLQQGKRALRFHDFSPELQANLLWLAPELLQQNLDGYGAKSDIYSLGIAVCEIANGFPPFADMEHMQMLLEKLRGTTPRLLDSATLAPAHDDGGGESGPGSEQRRRRFSDSCHNFAELCLKPNPEQRPAAQELMAHVFFKQLKKSRPQLTDLFAPLKPLSFPKRFTAENASRKASVSHLQYTDATTSNVEWSFN